MFHRIIAIGAIICLFLQTFCSLSAASPCDNLNIQLADFALRMIREGGEKSSAIISPSSSAIALAMLYVGAMNETKEEIRRAIVNGCDDNTIINYYSDIMHISQQPTTYTLNLANRIYTEKSLVLQKKFVEIMQEKFEGEIYTMDSDKPSETAKKINQWLRNKTNNKIDKLIDEQNPDLSDILIINAIYFNGSWQYPFKTSSTIKEKFFPEENQRIMVDMMRTVEFLPFAEDENVKVIGLPYKNEEISLYIFLPKVKFGLHEIEHTLDGSKLLALAKSCRKFGRVEVRIPKFTIKMNFPMKNALQKMGIRRAFSMTAANFSGICARPTHIRNFVHKALIEVNEGGTQAAAVSAIEMVFKSNRPIKRQFIANHPFLFALIKNETILFIGHFLK
uniref:Serpin B9 n=1 Tax=Ascaris suum TaxID=6253 RepID=F1L8Q8_ASCSU